MVYLIDDKFSRQRDFGWDQQKLNDNDDIIIPIRNMEDLSSHESAMLKDDNIILFHESFLISNNDEMDKNLILFKSNLNKCHNNIYVVYFSGSKNSRYIEGKTCMVPPKVLYSNLDLFLQYVRKGNVDLRYLAFGKQFAVESSIRYRMEKVIDANIDGDTISVEKNIFFAVSTPQYEIEPPFDGIEVTRNWDNFSSDVTDKNLDNLVHEWLDTTRYDVIYIPLYFGNIYSDYMGLRLAMHIRLTDTPNQNTPIFIYGMSSYKEVILNEISDVLKLSSVHLIGADNKSLIDSVNLNTETVDISKEIDKIHIDIPSNIGDNHSITNKWSRYRWSIALDDSDDVLDKNNEDIKSLLYFKYLTTKYPPSKIQQVNKEELTICKNDDSDFNILYVDDEADDGWYELLCHILKDINEIQNFVPIGCELKSKTQDEIIKFVMDEIKRSNINLVILDLRLHPDDFEDTNIENITGYKILNKIKNNYNRGVQVLMFSATNKIWNLQALQKEEADGFVMKEAPINSIEPHFTEESIKNFVKLLNDCYNRIYLKDLWSRIQKLNNRIDYHLRRNNIEERYAKNVRTLLSMAEDSLFDSHQDHSLDNAFLNLFTIIELTANEWIITREERNVKKHYFKDSGDSLRKFNFNLRIPGPGQLLIGDLGWKQKIANTLYYVNSFDENIKDLVNKRNNYTHPNGKLTVFSEKDVLKVIEIVGKIINNIEDKE